MTPKYRFYPILTLFLETSCVIDTYLMSHDEFDWIGIATKFARKIVAVTFFQVLVHCIFPQMQKHLTQIFAMGFGMIYAFDVAPPKNARYWLHYSFSLKCIIFLPRGWF